MSSDFALGFVFIIAETFICGEREALGFRRDLMREQHVTFACQQHAGRNTLLRGGVKDHDEDGSALTKIVRDLVSNAWKDAVVRTAVRVRSLQHAEDGHEQSACRDGAVRQSPDPVSCAVLMSRRAADEQNLLVLEIPAAEFPQGLVGFRWLLEETENEMPPLR